MKAIIAIYLIMISVICLYGAIMVWIDADSVGDYIWASLLTVIVSVELIVSTYVLSLMFAE